MRFVLLIFMTVLLGACAKSPEDNSAASTVPSAFTYPLSHTVDQTDDYHGQQVADPFRWLEELDSDQTRAWIEAQNAVTQTHLQTLPARSTFNERLTALWNYERYSVPRKKGERYFYSRNDGLQNQAVIYVQDSLDGEAKVVLDPNTLSADGTVSVNSFQVSPDGKLLAYSLSSGGSDWQEWKVRNIESGEDLADHVQWAKFSGASWLKDSSGFFYSRYDEPQGENKLKAVNKFHKLYVHRIGSEQAIDQLVYQREDQADWGFQGTVSEDGNYLLINVSLGTDERNLLFYKDLRTADSVVVELISEFDAAYDYVSNDGSVLYLRSDKDAERYKLIAIDLANPATSNWKDVIAQSDSTLQSVSFINKQFIAQYLTDARSEVSIFDQQGQLLRKLEFPGIGSANGFTGDADQSETFYSFSSYTNPGTIFHLDLENEQSSVFRQIKVNFDPAQYETRQVFYTSKDGTRIPMFISSRIGLALNGKNPTLLYGYGGFNISVMPSFSVAPITWMEQGGVYAVANLRGGGEYGKSWHAAGTKTQKQNVFDDFAAAGEYLIKAGYTAPQHLAITGRSNGGLLAAATALQRPDLFAATVPAVGVLDMLRFRDFTIGWAWESDYGSVKNADEFKALFAYSPLHNIKTDVNYPAFLITTADHDDRVYPAHSFKFAAALQAAYKGNEPMLIRVDTRAGHGAGKPTSKQIEEWADVLAFVAEQTKAK